MTGTAVSDFLKELAVGFRSAKSYPPGHPVMEKVITSTMMQLTRVYTEIPEFSIYFMEKTVIFQDIRIDVAKNLAIMAFLNAIKKNEIESITFLPGVTSDDIKNLYEVMSSARLKVKEYGDAATMLQARGTDRIRINAVKFGIQGQAAIQTAREAKTDTSPMAQADLIVAVKGLKQLVDRGVSALEIKPKAAQVMNMLEKVPADMQAVYSEAMVKILEQLPSEHRIELLKDIELKPFVLKLLSSFGEETLMSLLVTKAENQGDVSKIISTIGEEKLSKILPELKEKIPNIYEYLAQVGLLLSEKITTLFSKEDLRVSIKPYFNMLDSQNARLREEGLRSLIMLGERFVRQGQYEFFNEIIPRLSVALEHESVEEIVMRIMEPLTLLYKIARIHNQEKICRAVIDPFNRILGRPGLSASFKKTAIKFLSEIGDKVVLPALFSFLWESGIYPDVRAAIIKFGKDAVTEALLTLKEAEDYALRMKLVDILKSIGRASIEILIDNLDSPEWFLRRNIIAILGDIGENGIAPQMQNLLSDPDDRVRIELVKTFAKLDYEEGLTRLLQDSSMEVKAEALRAIKKMITNEAVKDLLPLLKEKGDALHLELLKIIGERRIDEALDHVVEFMKSLEMKDDSIAQNLKELAVTTIVKIGKENVMPVLQNLVSSEDKSISNLASTALKRIS